MASNSNYFAYYLIFGAFKTKESKGLLPIKDFLNTTLKITLTMLNGPICLTTGRQKCNIT